MSSRMSYLPITRRYASDTPAVPLTRVTRIMRPSSIGPSIFSRTWITGSLLRIFGSWSRVIFNALSTRAASSSATSRCSGTSWCSNTLNLKGGLPGRPTVFHLACHPRASRAGPRGLSGTPRGPQGPFEPRTTRFLSAHPYGGAVKSRMLFLGTVFSPSYLAELRALRLAAATCDFPPNQGLVLKFPVDGPPVRGRHPPGPHNYFRTQMKIGRCTMFYTACPSHEL